MKKKLTLIILLLIFFFIIGYKISESKIFIKNVFSEGTTYFFLQEGIYTSDVILNENTKDINIKLITKEKSKYYVYLGITKSETVAKKLKSIYEELGYQIYIKERKLNNQEFENNVTQFDILLNSTNSKDEILTIQEVVLANYEEIIEK